jgi:hypothetical protein
LLEVEVAQGLPLMRVVAVVARVVFVQLQVYP